MSWSTSLAWRSGWTARSAQRIYDHLDAQLARPEFTPRALLERFGIELLCTTDAATDTLDDHRQLHAEGLTHIRPTFRPDAVVNLDNPAWRAADRRAQRCLRRRC